MISDLHILHLTQRNAPFRLKALCQITGRLEACKAIFEQSKVLPHTPSTLLHFQHGLPNDVRLSRTSTTWRLQAAPLQLRRVWQLLLLLLEHSCKGSQPSFKVTLLPYAQSKCLTRCLYRESIFQNFQVVNIFLENGELRFAAAIVVGKDINPVSIQHDVSWLNRFVARALHCQASFVDCLATLLLRSLKCVTPGSLPFVEVCLAAGNERERCGSQANHEAELLLQDIELADVL
mmetsp:Transcript_7053/g.12611  ORF Transcript_7053/g.12611 Transcript_7053/m.12611 type:complete len:234 (-) Transcript_7053:2756-3457(-)